MPCIYTSGTRSLAILEYAANVEWNLLPVTLKFTIYETPGQNIYNIGLSDLPADWLNYPTLQSTENFGDEKLKNRDTLAFTVPSSVVPDEMNYIVNPNAHNFDMIRIVGTMEYVFDKRIKK